jgi:hypothetical protein
MTSARRALALLACAAALASSAPPADAAGHSRHAHKQVARAAVARLAAGHTYQGLHLDPASLVRVTVCFHRACASKQIRPEPTCDPSAGACIGTALRAWRLNRYTTVEVELL